MRVLLAAALALFAVPAAAGGFPPAPEPVPASAPPAPPAALTHTSTVTAVLSAVAVAPVAGPYMRPLDLRAPRLIAGGYFDVERVGESQAGTALALFTHATEDGCLLPSVVCMDWTPLAAGVLAKPGDVKFAFGPVFNAAPVLKAGLLRGLAFVTKDDALPGLKRALGSEPLDGPGASVSIGPAWVVAPAENFKGYFRVFLGGELRFGKKK